MKTTHILCVRRGGLTPAGRKEAQRRQQIVDFRIQTARMNKDKAVAKIKHNAKVLEDQLKRPLVSLHEMDMLTAPKIVDQLNSYRARGVPNIAPISHYRLKADKLEALKKAYEWYRVNGKTLETPALLGTSTQLVPQVVDDWEAEEDIEMED
ncbi:hypothetical protein B0H11DRAFT_1915389 [Mycena galericulata]|nr:hypothetical protein B0H11DRAFT_1915389 [Mycena galericulata]